MQLFKHVGDALVALVAAPDVGLAHAVRHLPPSVAAGRQDHEREEPGRGQAKGLAFDKAHFDEGARFGELVGVARLKGMSHTHGAAQRGIAGVLAARQAEPALSNRWVVFGHSDGAHGALGVEAHSSEAAGLTLLGTVAAAPYTTVPGIGASYAVQARAVSDPATLLNARVTVQMQGAFMATALLAQSPDWDPGAIMGQDLKALMPSFRAQCSVGAFNLVKGAVAAKGVAFQGVRPDWASEAKMHAFLTANDQGVMETFALHRPALIVQGSNDTFVSEPLNTALAARLRDGGAPLAYKIYPGADHFSILPKANDDVLAFLKARFGSGGADQ